MPYDSSWISLSRPGAAGDLFRPALSPQTERPPFEPDITEFSCANAWWFSELCRLAYRKGEEEAGAAALKPSRAELLAGIGFREAFFVNGGSSQCLLAEVRDHEKTKAYILVFRGSDRFENWLSNVSAIQTDWATGGMVHYGFKKEFDRIWPLVAKRLPETDTPVFFTGHSLGGAMAVLAAALRAPAAVYTFGAPRVGNMTFIRQLPSIPIYQFICHRDMVPHMPPSRIPFEFHHAGQIYHLAPKKDDALTEYSEQNFLQAKADSDPGAHIGRFTAALATLPGLIPGFLTDHSPINYTLGLCAALNSGEEILKCDWHPPLRSRIEIGVKDAAP